MIGSGFQWDVRALVNDASDFDSGTITYQGPASPAALSLQPGPLWGTATSFSTQADMDSANPTGDYTVNLANSGNSNAATGVVHYTGDAYPGNTPQLDAASYNGTQGMNAHNGYDFIFNAFDTGGSNPTESFVFFTLYDFNLGTVVLASGFLDASTTNFAIAANTLQAGHEYVYDIIFSNRIGDYDRDNNVFATQGWDSRTSGFFTTAADEPVVPEPASLSLIALGCGGFAALRRRRK